MQPYSLPDISTVLEKGRGGCHCTVYLIYPQYWKRVGEGASVQFYLIHPKYINGHSLERKYNKTCTSFKLCSLPDVSTVLEEGRGGYNCTVYLIYPQYWKTDGRARAGLPSRVRVLRGASGS